MDVRAGLDKYWASEAGIAERKRRSGDAFLAPRRAGGFVDGRLISTGLNDHHASDAGAVTREKQFKGRRDAKKKAFFATMDEQALAARAAEEQAPIEQREKELLELRRRVDERAEARAAQETARAEALSGM